MPASLTNQRGIDIRQQGNGLVVRALLRVPGGVLTTGTTVVTILEVQADGTVKTMEFAAGATQYTFLSTAVTTDTLAMAHQKYNNNTKDSGIWTVAITNVAGFTVGATYFFYVYNAGAAEPLQVREIQYGMDIPAITPGEIGGLSLVGATGVIADVQYLNGLKTDGSPDPSNRPAMFLRRFSAVNTGSDEAPAIYVESDGKYSMHITGPLYGLYVASTFGGVAALFADEFGGNYTGFGDGAGYGIRASGTVEDILGDVGGDISGNVATVGGKAPPANWELVKIDADGQVLSRPARARRVIYTTSLADIATAVAGDIIRISGTPAPSADPIIVPAGVTVEGDGWQTRLYPMPTGSEDAAFVTLGENACVRNLFIESATRYSRAVDGGTNARVERCKVFGGRETLSGTAVKATGADMVISDSLLEGDHITHAGTAVNNAGTGTVWLENTGYTGALVGAVINRVPDNAGVVSAKAAAEATQAIMGTMTRLDHWLRILARKTDPDATALAEMNAPNVEAPDGTYNPADHSLEAAGDVLAPLGMGRGAYIATITVKDSVTHLPLAGARVRVRLNADTFIRTTSDEAGLEGTISFGLDSGDWSVRVTLAGYDSLIDTLTVEDSDVAEEYEIVQLALTLPDSDEDCLVYGFCYDNDQQLEEGARVEVELLRVPETYAGHIHSGDIRVSTSDANGRVSWTLPRLSNCRARRGDGNWMPLVVDDAGTMLIADFVGAD